MRRILLLVTLASMLAAAMALSGVAQAKPVASSADRQCLKLAIQTLPNFKPAHYTFHGGDTDPSQLSDDFTDDATEGNDVFCGFLGPDSIETTLDAGDIFLGGTEVDGVLINNGTFYGQETGDIVGTNSGTFYGGAGDDFVIENFGTYFGQEGSDGVESNHLEGTFDGGAGDDFVQQQNDGTFYGQEGTDRVSLNSETGTFDGGDGTEDSVGTNLGCLIDVELGDVGGSSC